MGSGRTGGEAGGGGERVPPCAARRRRALPERSGTCRVGREPEDCDRRPVSRIRICGGVGHRVAKRRVRKTVAPSRRPPRRQRLVAKAGRLVVTEVAELEELRRELERAA